MTGIVGAVVWLVIAVVLFVVESLTVQMLCIWFAVGALVSMFASLLGVSTAAQFALFIVTSVAVLVIWQPFLKKRLTPEKTATNADAVIGQEGLVVEEIDNTLQTGRVSVGGLDWTARSEDGGIIPSRQRVMVKKIEGVKLIVEPAGATKPEKELQGV